MQARQGSTVTFFAGVKSGKNVLFAGQVHDFAAHGNASKMLVQAQRRGGRRRERVADAHAYAALACRPARRSTARPIRLERDGLGGAGYSAAFARSAVGAYAVFAIDVIIFMCGLLVGCLRVGRGFAPPPAGYEKPRRMCYAGRPVVPRSRRRNTSSRRRRCGQ